MNKEFIFYSHPEIKKDMHALISPSRHIIKPDYSTEQFENYIRSSYATTIGTSDFSTNPSHSKRSSEDD